MQWHLHGIVVGPYSHTESHKPHPKEICCQFISFSFLLLAIPFCNSLVEMAWELETTMVAIETFKRKDKFVLFLPAGHV